MSNIEDSSSSNASQNPSHGSIEIYKENKEAAKKMIGDENNYFLQAKKNLKPTKNAQGILILDIKNIEQYKIASSIQAVLDSRNIKKNDKPKIEYIKKEIDSEITEWIRLLTPQFELYSKITELKKEQQAFIKEISRLLSKEIEKSIIAIQPIMIKVTDDKGEVKEEDKTEALKKIADELAAEFEKSNIRFVNSSNIDSEDFINETEVTISKKVEEALKQIPESDTSTRTAFKNYNTIFHQLKLAGILDAFIDCNKARSCYIATYLHLPESIKQDPIAPIPAVVQEQQVIEQMSAMSIDTNNTSPPTAEPSQTSAAIQITVAPPTVMKKWWQPNS